MSATQRSDPAHPPHWADVLQLREEVLERQGHAAHLQMSLFEAVYQTVEVPYREASYWCDITQPTPRLVGFMADVARRVGSASGSQALYWLDQGMGGGKSHALVGLYHLVSDPGTVLGTEIGQAAATEAKARAGADVDLTKVRPVVLTADHFSPGVASPEFGPATTLHQRFLWSLFDARNDRTGRERYDEFAARGADKAALKEALRSVGRPVLILLDELMDYGMHLAGRGEQAEVEAEQGFLSALFDVVDDVPQVALVVVMISTSADEHGYEGIAGEFRGYVGMRLDRNNAVRLSVNEPQDFGAIIRRRIFQRVPDEELPIETYAQAAAAAADAPWLENVFERLPSHRQLSRLETNLADTYPFHPDLLDLVERDWVSYSGFQRVRSTVEIFSASAFYWATEHAAGRWAPPLIGVGDVPLHVAADQVLSSGILHGSDQLIASLRQVAQIDITNSERTRGRALGIDRELAGEGRDWADAYPQPAERMATALWMYSLVPRSQAKKGATKPELLAAVFTPTVSTFGFGDADEVFNRLIDEEEGLGALDVVEGRGGSRPARYVLSATKTLRMFHRTARSRLEPERVRDFVWERVRRQAAPGANFVPPMLIEAPEQGVDVPLSQLFGDVDQREQNRLVVLDPRRWTLLNGRDSDTRRDIEALLGIGEGSLSPSFAASCIVAVVNTQRRDTVIRRAREALAWQEAQRDIDPASELHAEAREAFLTAQEALDRDLRRAFQHVCFLVREGNATKVRFVKFEGDDETALSGNDVWARLVTEERAAGPQGVSGAYLHQLLDLSQRQYSVAEVTRKFWSDPTFPLVPDEDVARLAIFDALREDEEGVAWELVASNGDPLQVTSPSELAVHATDQYVRLGEPSDEEPGQEEPERSAWQGPEGPGEPTEEVRYVWHEVTLDTTALSDRERRDALWRFVASLDPVLDPGQGTDVQLASLKLRLNAAKGTLSEVKGKAEAAGARWVEREEEDFDF